MTGNTWEHRLDGAQSVDEVVAAARDFLARWRDGGTITLGPNPDATTATIRLTP